MSEFVKFSSKNILFSLAISIDAKEQKEQNVKNCRTIKLNVINGQFNRWISVLHKNSRELKFIRCEI